MIRRDHIIQLVINKVILIMQLCKSQFYLKTLSNRKILISNKTFYEKESSPVFLQIDILDVFAVFPLL